MGNVRFKIEDRITTAELLNQQASISPNTGKELFQLEVSFRAHENTRGFFTQALQNGTAMLLAEDGDVAKSFTVGLYEKQHSYTMGDPIQRCTWLLSQVEELNLESLQIADLTVNPYKYREEFSQDSLICNFCFDIDAETYKNVRNLPLYFPVVRKGISDEPRTMRFGQVLWASEDEQKYRIRTTLVEESYDKSRIGHGFFEPMLTNMMEQLVVTTLRLTKLLDLLESKGLVSEEEKKNVFEVPDSERKDRRELFYQIRDFDKWLENED
jgi:hypothetical protein